MVPRSLRFHRELWTQHFVHLKVVIFSFAWGQALLPTPANISFSLRGSRKESSARWWAVSELWFRPERMAAFFVSEATALLIYHLDLTISLGSKETSLAVKNSLFSQIPSLRFLKLPKNLAFCVHVYSPVHLYISFHLILQMTLKRQALVLVCLFYDWSNEAMKEHIAFPRLGSSRAESCPEWSSEFSDLKDLDLHTSPQCLCFWLWIW